MRTWAAAFELPPRFFTFEGVGMSAYDGLTRVSTAQVVTANAAQAASPVPCETHNEAEAYIVASAVGGTTPTVTPVLESSPDGTNWFTLEAGTAITANGNQRIAAAGNLGRFLRVNYGSVGGTTPTFTFNTWIHTKRAGV